MAESLPLPSPGDKQTIVCLYCGKPQEIGRRALTITCKHCNKSLKLEDLAFKAYEARRAIETCGTVTVEKKGHVVSDRIEMKPTARYEGDLTTAKLVVEEGAQFRGHVTVGPDAVKTKPQQGGGARMGLTPAAQPVK